VFDPDEHTVEGVETHIPTVKELAPGFESKWEGGVAVKWAAEGRKGEQIVGIPHNTDGLLVYEVSTCKATAVSTLAVAPGRGKWSGGVVGEDGKVYGIPHNADVLLVYDPVAMTVTGVDTSGIAQGKGKWAGGVMMEGKIYGVPHNADVLLEYAPATGELSGINIANIRTGKVAIFWRPLFDLNYYIPGSHLCWTSCWRQDHIKCSACM
jgi:hypothetical protein